MLAFLGLPTPTSIAKSVLNVFVQAFATDVGNLLNALFGFIATTTDPVFSSGWWTGPGHDLWDEVLVVSGSIMTLALMIAALQAVLSGTSTPLARAIGAVPMAAVKMSALVGVTSLLVSGTDQIADYFDANLVANSGGVALAVTAAITSTDLIGMIFAVLIVLAILALWAELVVRAAVIYVMVMTGPMVIAASIHPHLRSSWRKFAELGAGVIFSKVIVAIALNVAFSEMTGFGSSSTFAAGVGVLVTGVATLGLCCFSPFLLFRLIALEVAQLEGLSRRPLQAVRSTAQMAYYQRTGLAPFLSRFRPGDPNDGGGPSPSGGGSGRGGGGGGGPSGDTPGGNKRNGASQARSGGRGSMSAAASAPASRGATPTASTDQGHPLRISATTGPFADALGDNTQASPAGASDLAESADRSATAGSGRGYGTAAPASAGSAGVVPQPRATSGVGTSSGARTPAENQQREATNRSPDATSEPGGLGSQRNLAATPDLGEVRVADAHGVAETTSGGEQPALGVESTGSGLEASVPLPTPAGAGIAADGTARSSAGDASLMDGAAMGTAPRAGSSRDGSIDPPSSADGPFPRPDTTAPAPPRTARATELPLPERGSGQVGAQTGAERPAITQGAFDLTAPRPGRRTPRPRVGPSRTPSPNTDSSRASPSAPPLPGMPRVTRAPRSARDAVRTDARATSQSTGGQETSAASRNPFVLPPKNDEPSDHTINEPPEESRAV